MLHFAQNETQQIDVGLACLVHCGHGTDETLLADDVNDAQGSSKLLHVCVLEKMYGVLVSFS